MQVQHRQRKATTTEGWTEVVQYTDPEMVKGVRVTKSVVSRSVTGYGPKLPTRYMVKYLGRWRRVYVAQYSNAGTAYVVVNGADLVLDHATEVDLLSAQ